MKAMPVCPNCDSIIKEDVCLKCGHLFIDTDKKDEEGKKAEETSATSKKTSIFIELADPETISEKLDESVEAIIKAPSKAYPAVLGLLLFLLGALAYWQFVYLTPNYVSPLILSAHNIRDLVVKIDNDAELGSIPLTDIKSTEKTLDFSPDLAEGNFETGNFAQFAHPDINLFIQAFDIKDIYKSYVDGDLLKTLQDDFDVSDDDMDSYFTKGFALILPDKDLNMWGFVTEVQDKDFVLERVEKFKKNKENEGYKLSDLEVELVEVKIIVEGQGQVDEEAISEDEESEEGEEGEESKEPDEEEDSDSNEDSNSRYYLLMSNSKEFLDQMEESSEGNLPNLGQNIVFANAKSELPKIGQGFVYKKEDSITWGFFVDRYTSKFDYVGLDKILKDVGSNGIVFYSIVGKFKIIPSETPISETEDTSTVE